MSQTRSSLSNKDFKRARHMSAGGMSPTSGVVMPRVIRSRLTQATYFTHAETHGSRQGHHTIDHFQIDMRGLERNKYAPWGRGQYSGLPQ